MSNKDPAFLFYSSDFLTGTMLMTDEQVGRYIKLMCLQHQTGHLSEKDMVLICKEKDDKIFSKYHIDEDGLYYNKRLDDEILRRQEYSKSRKENGSKGGRPKKISNNHMDTTCKAYENHTETETETIKVSKKDLDLFFESIWSLYPLKKGKASVSDSKKRELFRVGYDEIKRSIKRYDSEVTDRQFMKHGSTFFNGGYVDYLDVNYQEPSKQEKKGNNEFDNVRW